MVNNQEPFSRAAAKADYGVTFPIVDQGCLTIIKARLTCEHSLHAFLQNW